MKGAGAIDIERQIRGNTKIVPGSWYANSRLKEWEYQCPVGVFNLVNVPDLYYRADDQLTYLDEGSSAYHYKYSESYRYIFKDELEFIVRDGIDIIDIKGAILVMEEHNANLVDNKFWSWRYGGKIWKNPVHDNLQSGRYIKLYQYEPVEEGGLEKSGVFEYGTPYMPLNALKFNNITAFDTYFEKDSKNHVYEKVNQTISLGVIMRYIDRNDPEQTIRVFKGKFKCNLIKYEKSMNWWKDDLNTWYKEAIANNQIGDFEIEIRPTDVNPHPKAEIIKFAPGVYNRNGFIAKATYTNEEYGNTVFNVIGFNCNYNVKPSPLLASRSALQTDEVATVERDVAVEASLYPNPTTGLVNLTGFEDVAKVEVYSMSGQMMDVIKGVEDSFDISHLADGMYIVRVYAGDDIQTYRIILQK